MVRFEDYDQIVVLTHDRTETATGHRVGHADDWALMAVAAERGWLAERIARVDDIQYVRSRLRKEPNVLNIITDFVYNPSPEERNVVVFDHHDPSRPTDKCSVHQLMEELVRQGLMREVPKLMDQISAWDTLGPNSVQPEDRPDPDRYFAILAAEPEGGFSKSAAKFVLKKLASASSLKDFVDELFYSKTSLGKAARRVHAEIQQKREEALEQILAGVPVQESPQGIKYIVLDKNPVGMLKEVFSRKGVDVVIHPNERNEDAFSIVRDSNRDSNGRLATTPVSQLVEVAPDRIVFCHPGGFLLVARPPFSIL